MIFQALGAKYTLGSALGHLFASGSANDSDQLRQALSEKYGGEVVLYRKGRAALAAVIRLATGGKGAVAISGLTCYSVVQAVEAAGCVPVFVEINEESLQFGAAELQAVAAENPGIKAVVVQNMLGIPVDIEALQKFAKKTGITLIEDLAHSAGATYASGQEVGTVGDITMLSFGRDKAIDAVNGGALIVRSDFAEKPGHPIKKARGAFRDRLYPLVAWLSRALYPVKIGPYIMALAIKLKLVVRSADGAVDETEMLSNWQAKLAHKQLATLGETAQSRREKAELYLAKLDEFAPQAVRQAGTAPIRVPLLVSNRDEVVAHLKKNGIQANDIWYDVPVSPVRLYDKVNYPEQDCPVAVDVAARLVNLPTHERISQRDIERIAQLVQEVAKA